MEEIGLGLVNGITKTLFARGFLHFVEPLFLLFQLSLHALHFILFLYLMFIPLHTTADAIAWGKMDRGIQAVDLALQVVY